MLNVYHLLSHLTFIFLGILALSNSQGIPSMVILSNVSYGSDPQQVMDIYLPGGRDASVSKVIVLIHLGGWSGGNKESMIGTVESPGFPKQLQDIALVLQNLTTRQTEYQILPVFGLLGISAGAHLSILYGYAWDKGLQVNAICNIIGPTDLTDSAYATIPAFLELLGALVGNNTLESNPMVFERLSPVYYITHQSPKTISFYGGLDPLIPRSQGTRLENALNAAGVESKYYLYPDEGHGFYNPNNVAHLFKQIANFFKNNL